MQQTQWSIGLNSALVLILSGILMGGFYEQFIEQLTPCPLCLLQRLGMLGVAMGALMNLRFGISTSHYAVSLLSALVGGSIALRQIALHICPDFPKFGLPVFGLSLYTWSFITFVCSILAITLLLFIYPKNTNIEPSSLSKGFSTLAQSAFFLIALITLINMIATLVQCGLGPCAD